MEPSRKKVTTLLAVDKALSQLAATDAQQGRIVETEVVGISTATVKRDWNIARDWLYRERRKGSAS